MKLHLRGSRSSAKSNSVGYRPSGWATPAGPIIGLFENYVLHNLVTRPTACLSGNY